MEKHCILLPYKRKTLTTHFANWIMTQNKSLKLWLTVTDGLGSTMFREMFENWYQIKVNQKNRANLLSSSVLLHFFLF